MRYALRNTHNAQRNTQQGSILIVVLWALFFLGMIAVAIYAHVRPQLDSAAKFINRTRAYYLAKAGTKRAILELEKGDKTPDYDALTDTWSNNAGAFKEIDLKVGTFSVVSGCAGERVSGAEDAGREGEAETAVMYSLTDEERKININKASCDILKKLLETSGVAEEDSAPIAAAIIDWRDKDDKSYMEEGAEDSYYTSLNPPYHCKNAKFDLIEELLLVKGVTPEIFDKIRESVTVYGEGAVNINTAGRPVLKSLGMGNELVEKIMRFRGVARNAADSESVKNVFIDAGSAAAALSAVEKLSNTDSAMMSKLFSQGLLGVKSDIFSGRSIGWVKNRSDSTEIRFVYDRNKKVLRYWREE